MNSPERYYFGGDRTKPVKKSDPPIFFQVSYLSHGAEVIKKIAFDNQLWLLRPVIMERGNLCLSTLTRAIVFSRKISKFKTKEVKHYTSLTESSQVIFSF